MKRHQTTTIDSEYLYSIGACPAGIDAVRRLLPAKISTDPEENIALAVAIDSEGCMNRLTWLFDEVAKTYCPACAAENDGAGSCHDDVYIAAQMLAMIADAIATKAGK